MINKIKVVNSYGEELTMTLRQPQLSGYAITIPSGINPTDVDIKSTQFVSGRKYKYNGGFHKYREINFNVLYYEDNILRMNVEQLRNNLYKYFKTGEKTKIYFEKNDIQYCIEGYISKHEAESFSANCSAKINVLCLDPWFRKFDMNYLDNKESDNTNSASIIYQGDISTGFVALINMSNEMKGKQFKLVSYHSYANKEMVINIPNDPTINLTERVLYIDLLSNVVNIQLLNGGISEKNCIGWIDSNNISDRQELPDILPGNNIIRFFMTDDISSPMSFNIKYNTLYRGL